MIAHYLGAAGIAAVAIGLRAALDPWVSTVTPFASLYGAVALSAWLGGVGPGLLASLGGYLLANYLFVEPRGTFSMDRPDLVIGFFLYLMSCSLIILFGEGMRRAQAKNREVEAALRAADRRKDEFIATLAHELRNPLAPILNAVQILRQLAPRDARMEEVHRIIERQAQQVKSLVEDLMDISRIAQGRLTMKRAPFDLKRAIAAAMETSRPLIDSRSHFLQLHLDDGPLPVEGDESRLTQVIANLLNNAAKYTDKGGTIVLSARREDGHVVVCVEDNGIGLAPEDVPKIFGLFQQVSTNTERGAGGLGIGLALVNNIVQMHEGRVEASSPGVGKGSVFRVFLPLAAHLPVASPAITESGLGPDAVSGAP